MRSSTGSPFFRAKPTVMAVRLFSWQDMQPDLAGKLASARWSKGRLRAMAALNGGCGPRPGDLGGLGGSLRPGLEQRVHHGSLAEPLGEIERRQAGVFGLLMLDPGVDVGRRAR